MTLAVLPAEPELGPQKRCTVCGDWWPLDPEFWYVRRYAAGEPATARGRTYSRHTPVVHFYSRCRACWADRAREQYVARRGAIA
jgi:hypothetical protein